MSPTPSGTTYVAAGANSRVSLSADTVDVSQGVNVGGQQAIDATRNVFGLTAAFTGSGNSSFLGKLGIGTASPARQLHVASGQADVVGIGITSYGGSSGQALGGLTVRQASGGQGGYLDLMTLQWGSGAYDLVSRVTVDYAGNVGINQQTPTYALEINRSSAGIKSSQANAVEFHLHKQDASAARDWVLAAWGSSAGGGMSGKLSLYDNTASAHRVVADSSGNVGIGNTKPTRLLQVGASQSDVLGVGATSYGGSTGQALGGLKARQHSTSGGHLDLMTLEWGSTYDLVTRMSIDHLGNVGIGTTSPGQKLDVNGDVTIQGTVLNLGGIKIIVGTGNPATSGLPAPQGSLFLSTDGDQNSSLYVKYGSADTQWAPK